MFLFETGVFIWPNVALNPTMTLKILSGDVLGSLFANKSKWPPNWRIFNLIC